MKWRGQGSLAVLVLLAAAAFGYQWTTVTKLEEEAMGRGIDYQPYVQRVAEFVDEYGRWPVTNEIELPTPPAGGVVRKAELRPDGEILVTLSAWTITSGRVQVVLAPLLQTQASAATPGPGRLRHSCLETNPARLERIVCRNIGSTTSAEVAEANADAFDEWWQNEADARQRQTTFNAAIATARNEQTRCDTLWQQAERDVIPCLQAIDSTAARNFRAASQQQLDGPRLRPEIIATNPDILEQFNHECDANWRSLVAMMKSRSAEFSGCFD